jgi:hypothetical protein
LADNLFVPLLPGAVAPEAPQPAAPSSYLDRINPNDPWSITNDAEFRKDLRAYYQDLGETLADDEELIRRWQSDRNWRDLNTFSMIRELGDAYQAGPDQRSRMVRLQKAWDAMPSFWQNGGRGVEALKDIVPAVIVDPINLIPYPGAKAGASAAFQAALKAQGKLLTNMAPDAAAKAAEKIANEAFWTGVKKGVIAEGAANATIGAIQDGLLQARDIHLGIQSDFDLGRLGVGAVVAGAGGAALGGALAPLGANAGVREVNERANETLGKYARKGLTHTADGRPIDAEGGVPELVRTMADQRAGMRDWSADQAAARQAGAQATAQQAQADEQARVQKFQGAANAVDAEIQRMSPAHQHYDALLDLYTDIKNVSSWPLTEANTRAAIDAKYQEAATRPQALDEAREMQRRWERERRLYERINSAPDAAAVARQLVQEYQTLSQVQGTSGRRSSSAAARPAPAAGATSSPASPAAAQPVASQAAAAAPIDVGDQVVLTHFGDVGLARVTPDGSVQVTTDDGRQVIVQASEIIPIGPANQTQKSAYAQAVAAAQPKPAAAPAAPEAGGKPGSAPAAQPEQPAVQLPPDVRAELDQLVQTHGTEEARNQLQQKLDQVQAAMAEGAPTTPEIRAAREAEAGRTRAQLEALGKQEQAADTKAQESTEQVAPKNEQPSKTEAVEDETPAPATERQLTPDETSRVNALAELFDEAKHPADFIELFSRAFGLPAGTADARNLTDLAAIIKPLLVGTDDEVRAAAVQVYDRLHQIDTYLSLFAKFSPEGEVNVARAKRAFKQFHGRDEKFDDELIDLFIASDRLPFVADEKAVEPIIESAVRSFAPSTDTDAFTPEGARAVSKAFLRHLSNEMQADKRRTRTVTNENGQQEKIQGSLPEFLGFRRGEINEMVSAYEKFLELYNSDEQFGAELARNHLAEVFAGWSRSDDYPTGRNFLKLGVQALAEYRAQAAGRSLRDMEGAGTVRVMDFVTDPATGEVGLGLNAVLPIRTKSEVRAEIARLDELLASSNADLVGEVTAKRRKNDIFGNPIAYDELTPQRARRLVEDRRAMLTKELDRNGVWRRGWHAAGIPSILRGSGETPNVKIGRRQAYGAWRALREKHLELEYGKAQAGGWRGWAQGKVRGYMLNGSRRFAVEEPLIRGDLLDFTEVTQGIMVAGRKRIGESAGVQPGTVFTDTEIDTGAVNAEIGKLRKEKTEIPGALKAAKKKLQDSQKRLADATTNVERVKAGKAIYEQLQSVQKALNEQVAQVAKEQNIKQREALELLRDGSANEMRALAKQFADSKVSEDEVLGFDKLEAAAKKLSDGIKQLEAHIGGLERRRQEIPGQIEEQNQRLARAKEQKLAKQAELEKQRTAKPTDEADQRIAELKEKIAKASDEGVKAKLQQRLAKLETSRKRTADQAEAREKANSPEEIAKRWNTTPDRLMQLQDEASALERAFADFTKSDGSEQAINRLNQTIRDVASFKPRGERPTGTPAKDEAAQRSKTAAAPSQTESVVSNDGQPPKVSPTPGPVEFSGIPEGRVPAFRYVGPSNPPGRGNLRTGMILVPSRKQLAEGGDLRAMIAGKIPANHFEAGHVPAVDHASRSGSAKADAFVPLKGSDLPLSVKVNPTTPQQARVISQARPLTEKELTSLKADLDAGTAQMVKSVVGKDIPLDTFADVWRAIDLIENKSFPLAGKLQVPGSAAEIDGVIRALEALYAVAPDREVPKGTLLWADKELTNIFKNHHAGDLVAALDFVRRLVDGRGAAPRVFDARNTEGGGSTATAVRAARDQGGAYTVPSANTETRSQANAVYLSGARLFDGTLHEMAHWAYFNVLSAQDRLNFWNFLKDNYYVNGALDAERLAADLSYDIASDKVLAISPQEVFADFMEQYAKRLSLAEEDRLFTPMTDPTWREWAKTKFSDLLELITESFRRIFGLGSGRSKTSPAFDARIAEIGARVFKNKAPIENAMQQLPGLEAAVKGNVALEAKMRASVVAQDAFGRLEDALNRAINQTDFSPDAPVEGNAAAAFDSKMGNPGREIMSTTGLAYRDLQEAIDRTLNQFRLGEKHSNKERSFYAQLGEYVGWRKGDNALAEASDLPEDQKKFYGLARTAVRLMSRLAAANEAMVKDLAEATSIARPYALQNEAATKAAVERLNGRVEASVARDTQIEALPAKPEVPAGTRNASDIVKAIKVAVNNGLAKRMDLAGVAEQFKKAFGLDDKAADAVARQVDQLTKEKDAGVSGEARAARKVQQKAAASDAAPKKKGSAEAAVKRTMVTDEQFLALDKMRNELLEGTKWYGDEVKKLRGDGIDAYAADVKAKIAAAATEAERRALEDRLGAALIERKWREAGGRSRADKLAGGDVAGSFIDLSRAEAAHGIDAVGVPAKAPAIARHAVNSIYARDPEVQFATRVLAYRVMNIQGMTNLSRLADNDPVDPRQILKDVGVGNIRSLASNLNGDHERLVEQAASVLVGTKIFSDANRELMREAAEAAGVAGSPELYFVLRWKDYFLPNGRFELYPMRHELAELFDKMDRAVGYLVGDLLPDSAYDTFVKATIHTPYQPLRNPVDGSGFHVYDMNKGATPAEIAKTFAGDYMDGLDDAGRKAVEAFAGKGAKPAFMKTSYNDPRPMKESTAFGRGVVVTEEPALLAPRIDLVDLVERAVPPEDQDAVLGMLTRMRDIREGMAEMAADLERAKAELQNVPPELRGDGVYYLEDIMRAMEEASVHENMLAQGLVDMGFNPMGYALPVFSRARNPFDVSDNRIAGTRTLDHIVAAIGGAMPDDSQTLRGKEIYDFLVSSVPGPAPVSEKRQIVNDALRSLGYDSIRFTETEGRTRSTMMVVFDRENVKSIYDPLFQRAETDIQLSVAPREQEPSALSTSVLANVVTSNDNFDIGPKTETAIAQIIETVMGNTDAAPDVAQSFVLASPLGREKLATLSDEGLEKVKRGIEFLNPRSMLATNSRYIKEVIGANWLADKLGTFRFHDPNSVGFVDRIPKMIADRIIPVQEILNALPDRGNVLQRYARGMKAWGDVPQPKSHEAIIDFMLYREAGDMGRARAALAKLDPATRAVAERAIERLTKTFDEELKAHRAAGSTIGEVKNFFPHVVDVDEIRKNKDAAIAFYSKIWARDRGVSVAEVKGDVTNWLDKLIDQDGVWLPTNAKKSGAVFESGYQRMIRLSPADVPEAKKFLARNLESVLHRYFDQSVKRRLQIQEFGVGAHMLKDYMKVAEGGVSGIAELLSTDKIVPSTYTKIGGDDYGELTINRKVIPAMAEPRAREVAQQAYDTWKRTRNVGEVQRVLLDAMPKGGEGYARRAEAIANGIADFGETKVFDPANPRESVRSTHYHFVNDMMRVLMGRPLETGPRAERLGAGSRFLRNVNSVTLLGFTTLASLGDTVLPLVRSGDFKAWVGGMAKMASDPEFRRAIHRMGVNMENAVFNRQVGLYGTGGSRWADSFFHTIGLNAWTNVGREMAAAVAVESFRNAASIMQDPARKGTRAYRQAKHYLSHFGLDGLAEGGTSFDSPAVLSRDEIAAAAHRFAQESIFAPNNVERPLWTQTWWGSMAYQLKSFPMMMGRLARYSMGEVGRWVKDGSGNPMPALYMLTVGTGMGAAVNGLRDIVQMRGGDDEQSAQARERKLSEWLQKNFGYEVSIHGPYDKFLGTAVEGMFQMGGFGMVADLAYNAAAMADNGYYGAMRLASWFLGPSFSLVGIDSFNVLAGLLDSNEDSNAKERAAVRTVAGRIPVVGGIRSAREAIVEETVGDAIGRQPGRGGFPSGFNNKFKDSFT